VAIGVRDIHFSSVIPGRDRHASPSPVVALCAACIAPARLGDLVLFAPVNDFQMQSPPSAELACHLRPVLLLFICSAFARQPDLHVSSPIGSIIAPFHRADILATAPAFSCLRAMSASDDVHLSPVRLLQVHWCGLFVRPWQELLPDRAQATGYVPRGIPERDGW